MAGIQQQLLGERRLARVGVRDEWRQYGDAQFPGASASRPDTSSSEDGDMQLEDTIIPWQAIISIFHSHLP